MSAATLVEHFFRHEYGRLIATLSRRTGLQYTEYIEDAVQWAMMRALERWSTLGPPQNPSAWLFRVSCNRLMGELRQRGSHQRLLERFGAELSPSEVEEPGPLFAKELKDDFLKMLFVCCDDALPPHSQLILALKTLCGFSVREISHRLFCSEEKVYKRLSRARARLSELPHLMDDLNLEIYLGRLDSVMRVLYLLFTEGYLSSHAEMAIRRELCGEAIRLATVLAEHPVGQSPKLLALLALMHLHSARLNARLDGGGGLLLLEEQDRALFDTEEIEVGLSYLARSAQGDCFSRYHAEAGIAAEHCLAESFKDTRWDKVVECYTLLENLAPSALHRLNRAVAMAEWKGAKAGLEVLEDFEAPSWLSVSYLWAAVLADLYRRCGDAQKAAGYRRVALNEAPTPAIKTLVERRLGVEKTQDSLSKTS